jgi:hypothetical protein
MAAISIPQPSMALHSWNVPGWKYEMYNTWFLSQTEEMQHIADWTTEVASGAPGSSLRCLVLNAHGACGRVALSTVATLTTTETAKFAQMKGKVTHILIIACSVIGVKAGDNKNFWSDPGVNMTRQLARQTGARVYAANVPQSVELSASLLGGKGDIDEFEGDILHMPPDGRASWLSSNYALHLMLSTI